MKKFNITINGKTYAVDVEEVNEVSTTPNLQNIESQNIRTKSIAPQNATQQSTAQQSTTPQTNVSSSAAQITAPMPGTIFEMKVKEGDAVVTGEVVLVLEAMKMENEIFSPTNGVIKSVMVKTGGLVNAGDILIEIE